MRSWRSSSYSLRLRQSSSLTKPQHHASAPSSCSPPTVSTPSLAASNPPNHPTSPSSSLNPLPPSSSLQDFYSTSPYTSSPHLPHFHSPTRLSHHPQAIPSPNQSSPPCS